MVEVRIPLDKEDHRLYLKYKKVETWTMVLRRGIESLAYFPNDMDWVDECAKSDLYLHLTNEEGELK